jgi:energy-coupling factor transport system permease protein
MEARCYRGGIGRTRLNNLVYKKIDKMAFFMGAIFFIGILMLAR